MDDETLQESLVVLDQNNFEQTYTEIESEMDILQRVSARVFVIRASAPALQYLARVGDAVAVIGNVVPVEVMRTLDESERLWVTGWVLRRTEKSRSGDGLTWDAPGFVPPDRR